MDLVHLRNNQKFGRYSYCYIGGGFVVCTGDTLTLFGKSEAVGSVPYRLLELFRLEILSFYREDRPFLRRISIEVPRESKHDGDKGVAFLDELLEPTTDGTGNPGDRLLRDDLLESISRRNELSPESETESETEYTSKPSGLEID